MWLATTFAEQSLKKLLSERAGGSNENGIMPLVSMMSGLRTNMISGGLDLGCGSIVASMPTQATLIG